jgi:hypothetical protein
MSIGGSWRPIGGFLKFISKAEPMQHKHEARMRMTGQLTLAPSTPAPRSSSARTHSTCCSRQATPSAVPPSFCAAQSSACEQQRYIRCTTLCSTPLQQATRKCLSAMPTRHRNILQPFAHPSSQTNNHTRLPQTTYSPRLATSECSQLATHAHYIHARAPVQQQPHTLHLSFLTSTIKRSPAVQLHSAVNRTDPCRAKYNAAQHCIQQPNHACQQNLTTYSNTHPVAFTHQSAHTSIHKHSPHTAQSPATSTQPSQPQQYLLCTAQCRTSHKAHTK